MSLSSSAAGFYSLAGGLMHPVSCYDWTAALSGAEQQLHNLESWGHHLSANKNKGKMPGLKSTKHERMWKKKSLWGHVTAENEHGSCWQVGFWRCWSRCCPLYCGWNTEILFLCMQQDWKCLRYVCRSWLGGRKAWEWWWELSSSLSWRFSELEKALNNLI